MENPHKKRVMGFEPTNNSLGSYRLTTWRHPQYMVIADAMTAIYSRFLMFFEVTFFES